jgi:threonyl-tRNA synthetase
VWLDDRNEKLGFKIRDAELQKVPFMGVIGPKETESSQISLRRRKEGDLGPQNLEFIIHKLQDEIRHRISH